MDDLTSGLIGTGIGAVVGYILGKKTVGVANPAAEYCAFCGGQYYVETDPVGGQRGVCSFGDPYPGLVDAWEFYCNDTVLPERQKPYAKDKQAYCQL